MNRYHDTVPETPENVRRYALQAEKQDDAILELFRRNPDKLYGPSEVERLFDHRWPITSIRRSITNLTEINRLIKTENRRKGPHGRSERLWKYRRQEPVQERLL